MLGSQRKWDSDTDQTGSKKAKWYLMEINICKYTVTTQSHHRGILDYSPHVLKLNMCTYSEAHQVRLSWEHMTPLGAPVVPE